MKIAILSRGPQLYSTRSLVRAGMARRHEMHIVDHTRCSLVVEAGTPNIYYDGLPLSQFDAVIPRIGASVTSLGASVISQFEAMGVFCATSSKALLQARDKLRCLQQLVQHGLQVPSTIAVADGQDLWSAVEHLGGLPVVVKLLEGTHGLGVVLADSYRTVEATVEAFKRLRERVILQEFIREAAGADVRVLVVGGRVVAAMSRQSRRGEFRSNLHRGAKAGPAVLSPEEEAIALRSVGLMGLDIGGVDFLRSERGPLVLEVNASPGLEGIETASGANVADAILQFVEGQRRGAKNKQHSP